MSAKIRFSLYFMLLIVGILLIFWINHGWQVVKYCRKTLQPLVETQRAYALRKQKIVLSLTTTPYRIDKLQPVLETLFKQNVKADHIYLNLPYVFKRDNIAYQIPEWLQQEKRVTILRTEDYGPATKLLGTLRNAQLDPDTIIITVDDDMYYPPNLVLHLAYEARKNPHKVIALLGGDMAYDSNGKLRTRGLGFDLVFAPQADLTAVLGYAGVAYRAEFFDQHIYAIDAAPHECYMHDDLYISFHLARKRIARQNLATLYVTETDIKSYDPSARHPQSLYIITPNRANLSLVCLAHLHAQYPGVNFDKRATAYNQS